MKVSFGNNLTGAGPGVEIKLTAEEVATAIDAYLVSRNVNVSGPRTITVNGSIIKCGHISVDPIGKVVYKGIGYAGVGVKF